MSSLPSVPKSYAEEIAYAGHCLVPHGFSRSRILRAETASLTALSIIMYERDSSNANYCFCDLAVVSTNTIRTAYGAYLQAGFEADFNNPADVYIINTWSPVGEKVSPAHPADQEAQ